ncbi:dTDP-4-dehydrorhamnose reductase [uncultured Shewanella sp.]|uniref:dTDP-4-dehydrorhamnose reductase n=1 Tax=uncultured Shewanella sp. TaxID=173975 RepID=UPI002604AD5A|nr:dTDP-4-dehydrorhamnose reductase [uncultured Shewanella sp.]
MKVWLVGKDGQLGQSLIAYFKQNSSLLNARFKIQSTNKSDVDICNSASVSRYMAMFKPDIIVNAAAYTNVEQAETDIELCREVNLLGTNNLAKAASHYKIPLIHLSTDYVFDGQSVSPYLETDDTQPLNSYGETKLQSEALIRAELKQHLIIRTSWLISQYGNNFAKTVLRLSKQHSQLAMISDQQGCPTFADDLSAAVFKLLMAIDSGQADWGTFHYCGSRAMTWFELTQQILDEALKHKKINSKPEVVAISSEAFALQANTKALRPKYSVLGCQKIKQVWGITRPDWTCSLKRLVDKL